MDNRPLEGVVEFFFREDEGRPSGFTDAKKALDFDLLMALPSDFKTSRPNPDGAEAEDQQVMKLGQIRGVRGDRTPLHLTVVYRADVFGVILELAQEGEDIHQLLIRVRDNMILPKLRHHLEGREQILLVSPGEWKE